MSPNGSITNQPSRVVYDSMRYANDRNLCVGQTDALPNRLGWLARQQDLPFRRHTNASLLMIGESALQKFT